MGDAQQQRNRRRFTEEFKREAVNLVRSTGRPIAAVGRELGIYDSTLGNWVRQDRIRPRRGRGLPQKSGPGFDGWRPRTRGCGWSLTCSTNRGLLGRGTVDAVSRYRCVDAQKAVGFPVVAACRAAGVSTSAYYAWAARPSPAILRSQGWSPRSAPSTPTRTAPTGRRGSPPSCAGGVGGLPRRTRRPDEATTAR